MPKAGQLKGTASRREEFLNRLRTLGPGEECVFWPWSSRRHGYVRIYIDGQKLSAHRWVFEQFNGPLPPIAHVGPRSTATQVCHTCDNPPCVRPSHLFAGSNTDNAHDASVKRRLRGHGALVQGSNLNELQVIAIRLMLKAELSQQKIADVVGISRTAVNRLARGETYRDL